MEVVALEFRNPAFGDFVDRHRVDEVQFFTALAAGCKQVGVLEDGQVLRYGLSAHGEALA